MTYYIPSESLDPGLRIVPLDPRLQSHTNHCDELISLNLAEPSESIVSLFFLAPENQVCGIFQSSPTGSHRKTLNMG